MTPTISHKSGTFYVMPKADIHPARDIRRPLTEHISISLFDINVESIL